MGLFPVLAILSTTQFAFSPTRFTKMENDQGEIVDIYVPRKCSSSNRILAAKDHASVQITIAEVDESGRYTGSNIAYNICGEIRRMGESDDAVNRLSKTDGIIDW